MSHGNSHDTHQGLHDEVHQEDPPSRQFVDLRSDDEMQDPENEDTENPDFSTDLVVEVHQEDSPSRKPVDLKSNDEMQDPENEDTENPNFSADPLVEVLYEENFSGGKYHWTRKTPKKISREAADPQSRIAIKLFKIKDRDKSGFNGKYPMKAYRVDVQNPQLVCALAPIVRKENVYLDPGAVATFKEPFYPLWFRHNEIVDLFSKKQGDPLEPLLRTFLTVLAELFLELSSKAATLYKCELIDFKTAWTLFPRDSQVYGRSMNSHFLGKVVSIKYEGCPGDRRLLITCKTISFSGGGFFWYKRNLTIPEFAGNKPIYELGFCPPTFLKDKESIMGRLTARGRKVLDLQGLAHRTYDGIAIQKTDSTTMRHNVNGRILIDARGYDKYHLNQGQREINDPEKDWVWDRLGNNKKEMLPKPEELVFMSETISGFALKNKLWFQFYVEDIQPIVWQHEAYSHFVFDEEKKDLVLSLVQNHSMNNGTSTAMQDVIVEKGQGLIVLLSGPPGTGKTLMAEAVADHLHRPLYYLQAEDLGTQAASLGANFKRVSELTTAWNAIILLDEADIFMAPREPGDVKRKGLTSAFLRELEYFGGIIFLTTNVVNPIDTAFRGRVSIHLVFTPLVREMREKIWRMFLGRLPQHRRRIWGGGEEAMPDEPYAMPLDDRDMAELALWRLGGREIKTVIQIVHSWCCSKNCVMTLARLEYGIRAVNPYSIKSMRLHG